MLPPTCRLCSAELHLGPSWSRSRSRVGDLICKRCVASSVQKRRQSDVKIRAATAGQRCPQCGSLLTSSSLSIYCARRRDLRCRDCRR
jgi:hypothetical protein